MTDKPKSKGAVALKDATLEQATGGSGPHVKVFSGKDSGELTSEAPDAAAKPGRTTFANIVLERG